MISLPQGFKIASREAIDVRLILSKADMISAKDSTMPDVYFTICKDDGKMYIYQKSNPVTAETGKYRLYAAGNSVNIDAETAETIISTKEGNLVTFVEDGLYVEEPEVISEITIQNLFSNENKNN